MERVTRWALIAGFVGLLGFSASLFFMDSDHGAGCAATAIDGKTCVTNLPTHHISVWQSITNIPLTDIYQSALLAAAVLAAAFLALFSALVQPLILARQRYRELDLVSRSRRQRIASWLSLFELSPAR